MYRKNALKKKLLAGAPVLSSWLRLASPVAAEIMPLVGYDGAVIDLQHGSVDYFCTTTLMRAMPATPTTPIYVFHVTIQSRSYAPTIQVSKGA